MSRPVIACSGKGEPPGAFGYESDGRFITVPEAHDNGKASLLSYVTARGREINVAKKRATRTHQRYRKYGRKTRQGGFHILPHPPICRVMPLKIPPSRNAACGLLSRCLTLIRDMSGTQLVRRWPEIACIKANILSW